MFAISGQLGQRTQAASKDVGLLQRCRSPNLFVKVMGSIPGQM